VGLHAQVLTDVQSGFGLRFANWPLAMNLAAKYAPNSFLIVLALLLSPVAGAIEFPTPDWQTAPDAAKRMQSPECREFIDFATRPSESLTDGLVVIKDGLIQFETYGKEFTAEKPHILWSVSKTITGALLGIAVRDGRVSLDDALSRYWPAPATQQDPNYGRITVKNLFYMDTGFIWNEFEKDLPESPVIQMLYGMGTADMSTFVTRHPIAPRGPGTQWRYSTGSSTLMSGVLKQAYGDEYERLPWRELFEPIGMSSAAFERDKAGGFVGGGLSYATPRDLAKLGYLYLNRGRWNGRTILPEEWIERTLTPSPGFLTGDFGNPIDLIGTYGGSIWLNRSWKEGAPLPFPNTPDDMYLAYGLQGQLMIVLPSQHMVIARTGNDDTYAHKVDAFVSRAVSCFADPNAPIGEVNPKFSSPTPGLVDTLKALRPALHEGLIQNALAKSVCSCTYVSKARMETCVERSKVEMAEKIANMTMTEGDSGKKQVQVRLTWLGRKIAGNDQIALAEFDPARPQLGCTLLTPGLPADPSIEKEDNPSSQL
jgi:CubicO group peptidase (beta-lactamase class C family)